MRLKRLELFGFKSFADRTVMDFGQTTLTGIVGPNGCGKSNVVDAVRWVLGETRPTSMRGSGMTDVIFKGSASRPAMGTAEVTMILDNGANVLPERGPEVAISRRLYASGEGEYLIDGQRVRLKDVKDLLFDTGLGSRGYSVLEQGRIDAVLSANPAQRRAIFEEAAGISRYRQRRHETELRLNRCEQDVERLEDVMGELRSRVRSLKIQAGKAEKYVVAKEEWTRERTRLLSHRLVGYDRTLDGLGPMIAELEAGLGELREQRAECEGLIEEREAERSEVVEQLSSIGDEASRISGDLRALEERKSQLAMRIASWAASASEESERAAALEAQLQEREDELSTLGADVEAIRERAIQAEERAQGLGQQFRELNRTYKDLRQEVQAQNDRVLATLHERTAAENRVVHLTEALPPSEERLERVVQRFTAAEAQIAEVQDSVTIAEEGLGLLAENVLEADQALEATREERASVDESLEERRRARAEREVLRAGHQSRVEALLDRERELEDLSGGARRVLEAAETGDGPCRKEELLGLVADHLKADVRLARAIDAVLGDRAHALVASDAHAARRIVDWCASEEVGQVGVVIPPGVGAPDCPPPSDYALFARFGAGVEGRLGDLVRCEESMRPLVHALFCDVVVVSSLDIALDLVGREPGWRFVTPRGELVDSAGIVGGYRDVAHGFVGRRSSAADLEHRIEDLNDAIAADDDAIEAAQMRISRLAEILKVQAQEREAARKAQSEAEASLSAARARLKDLASAMASHADERGKAEADVARMKSELESAVEAKTRAGDAFEAENERLEQMEKGRRQLETEREDLQREEAKAQVELSSAKAELSGLEQRITSLERLLVETRSEIERSGTRAVTYENSAQEGRVEVEGIVVEAETLGIARQELDDTIESLRERERSGAARISETRRAAEAVQSELDSHGELLGKHRLEAQKADLARQEIVGRAMEELELAEHDLREAFVALEEELGSSEELKALEKHVASVKSELDRLGPVNVEAVHELEEVGGRLDHLETQSADLAEARKTLLDTIKTIDEESRRLFVDTFEEVRANFQRIFRLLFGGGKADVRLEEGVDVLDAGVEIVARPPGRELLAIGLLSGGQRTMTALALLFAVFEARPSPFCVLDEVDAALDDANVDRFLGMLDGFRETTQFIVVTHNKGTMAASQALYGVTMQVKGVSRFVSVELDEIDEFVPETIGTAKRPKEGDGGAGSAASSEAASESPARSADRDPETGEPIKEIPSQRARELAEADALTDSVAESESGSETVTASADSASHS
ncbi:Chromosome partition protein Smc [Planctomycetes bacterium Poly30]|uniref:Chromosome partition protein Smc n=1 Tax=Saltatorellus ferox TaxID=2528018 RepID=A0A518ES52_9BACT|nr:Chromosome partition protein Smc [Planctomycetes bacterium Poly30]